MAMSRSFGARSFTTSPSMRSSPREMSSRPAIMLRVVDLPHPEGPTRMQNSPSSISKLRSLTAKAPSGYCLVTWSRVMPAIGSPSALHRARGEPGDDPTLEEQHEHEDGDADDHGRGGDVADRVLEAGVAGEEPDLGRHRPGSRRRGQGDGEQEVVPAEEEHQDHR